MGDIRGSTGPRWALLRRLNDLEDIPLTKNTWILIADGSRANIYSLSEDRKQVHPVEGWDHKGGRSTSNAIVEADASTHRAAKGSEAVSGTAEADPKRHSQQVFAKELAAVLQERHTDYDELIVVASPKVLGDLRKDFANDVQQKIVAEFHKDLTHVSAHDLPAHLEKLMTKA
jgi:protein required for attachment to host cells